MIKHDIIIMVTPHICCLYMARELKGGRERREGGRERRRERERAREKT